MLDANYFEETKKPTSKRRQESSRANGAKSRGPVTPEGKARSSQNAVKHGCLATFITLSPEEEEQLHGIRHGYDLRYQPRDQPECDYVERIVVCNFQMRLCWVRANALLGLQMALDDERFETEWANLTDIDRSALSFVESIKDSAAIDRLYRYARSFGLQADAASKMLMMMRDRRLPPTGNPGISAPDAGPPAPAQKLRKEPSPKNEQMEVEENKAMASVDAQTEATCPAPQAALDYIFQAPRVAPVWRKVKFVARFVPEPEPKQEIKHEKYMVCGG